MTSCVRLNAQQLRRVFNSARSSSDIVEALERVQDSVLAANGLLSEEETRNLRATLAATQEPRR